MFDGDSARKLRLGRLKKNLTMWVWFSKKSWKILIRIKITKSNKQIYKFSFYRRSLIPFPLTTICCSCNYYELRENFSPMKYISQALFGMFDVSVLILFGKYFYVPFSKVYSRVIWEYLTKYTNLIYKLSIFLKIYLRF